MEQYSLDENLDLDNYRLFYLQCNTTVLSMIQSVLCIFKIQALLCFGLCLYLTSQLNIKSGLKTGCRAVMKRIFFFHDPFQCIALYSCYAVLT